MDTRQLRQYESLDTGLGWWELSPRGKVAVTGPDRVTFLHALTSTDIAGLDEYRGTYGFLLQATGKIRTDFLAYRLPELMLLDAPEGMGPVLQAWLESFVIMDDVVLEDLTAGVCHFAVEGPAAETWIRDRLGMSPPAEILRLQPAEPRMAQRLELPMVVRRDHLSSSGFEVLAPASERENLRRDLSSSGPELEDAVLRVRRLERWIPTFGREFSERNNPVEVGLRSGYSLSKGCYPGQEVVSKATYVGGVARLLCCLLLEGCESPPEGSVIRSAEGKVGSLVSAGYSPLLERVPAFGYVKRAAALPGSRCEVATGDASWVPAELLGPLDDVLARGQSR